MSKREKPYVAITMGDPAGIGSEVTAKALTDRKIYEECRPFVIGNSDAMADASQLIGSYHQINVIQTLEDVKGQYGTLDILDIGNLEYSTIIPGQVSAASGKASVEWILKAGELASSGQVQAVVTAPINKEASNLAGHKDIGHMEIFQRQTGAQEVATMLIAKTLRVVHLTTHRSLRIACDYVTKDNVLAKIKLTHANFQEWGFKSPRIGIAALNPHASDGGLLGDEEEIQIQPAVEKAKRLGINANGPVPPDTIFTQALNGRYDVIIAMYHDQGHIAIKVHDWKRSISVNLGLPFVRTSVDHGTAFDISGKGIAHHESMLESIRVAVSLAKNKQLP